MNIEVGGLTILNKDYEELREAVYWLNIIVNAKKEHAAKFLRCWAKTRGAEVHGWEMHLLAQANFLPDKTFEEARKIGREYITMKMLINNEHVTEERIDEKLEEWMDHCFESSEGVIWLG